MEEEHDLANLHPLLPGTGDPFAALWPNAIDGFQIAGIVGDHVQDPCTEVFDQLLCQNGADSFHEAAGQIPFNALIRCWRNRFQDRGLELKTVLLIPDPPSLCGQPLPRTHRRQGAEDGHQISLSANLHAKHSEPALLVEEGDPFYETGDLFRRGTRWWWGFVHPDRSLCGGN